MSKFVIESLEIAYGKTVAVKGFNLTIEEGELVCLLGPSGSGKTSVLRAMGGYLKPSGGRIMVDGSDITRDPPQIRDMGMVFQNFVLFPHMSALANVEFGLRTRGVGKSERRRRAIEALDMVQMNGLHDRFPFQLSGGQQQRTALARALVIRPKMLLMDEPLGALDAKLRAQAQEEIRSVQQKVGVPTILVTHDQQEAMVMSDRIVVMRDGEIADEGDPSRLYKQPQNAFTAEFVGSTNLLPVDVLRGDGCEAKVRVCGSDHEFVVSGAVPASNVGYICLRPEDIRYDRAPVEGAVSGRVTTRMFYGLNTFLRVDVSGLGSVLALEAHGDQLVAGEHINVWWRPESARLLPRDEV